MTKFYKELYTTAKASKEKRASSVQSRVAEKPFADALEKAFKDLALVGEFSCIVISSPRKNLALPEIERDANGDLLRTDFLPAIDIPFELYEEVIAVLRRNGLWFHERAGAGKQVSWSEPQEAPVQS